jgi:hypothetical protein
VAENRTQPTAADVQAFFDAVPDPERRSDAVALCELMHQVTGEPPRMWGPSIVGFGSYHYRYDSGREGDAAAVGFSPRAKELVIYLPADAPDRAALVAQLGKHKTGKSCLYIRSLADVDRGALGKLIVASYRAIKERHPD